MIGISTSQIYVIKVCIENDQHKLIDWNFNRDWRNTKGTKRIA